MSKSDKKTLMVALILDRVVKEGETDGNKKKPLKKTTQHLVSCRLGKTRFPGSHRTNLDAQPANLITMDLD